MVDSFEFFLDFIKYLLPALVIFLVVYYQQKAFFDDKPVNSIYENMQELYNIKIINENPEKFYIFKTAA